MAKLESILRGARNIACAAGIIAGSLIFPACNDNPVVPPIEPPSKPKPSISLTAELKNFADVKYDAAIKNLNNATITISRNGNPVVFRMITDSIYSETLSYSTDKKIIKGDYNFTLVGKTLAGKDTSITTNLTVPNYSPEINISGVNAEFDEDCQTTVNLESRIKNTDKNPEDNPVSIAGVSSIDGKTEASVEGYNATIKGKPGQIGNYLVKIEAGSEAGGKSTASIQGNICDLLDIDGFLKDNEQHLSRPGVVRVYDGKINPSTGKNRRLGEMQADESGHFSGRLNYRISELKDNIFIQGRGIRNKQDTTSFMTTFKLPLSDVKGLEIAVVPYDGLAEHAISVDQFEKHAYEVCENTSNIDGVVTKYNLWKWDFGEFGSGYPFREVVISKKSDDTTIANYFSQETAENIKSRILDAEDIGAWFRGKINNSNQIRIVDKWNLDYNNGSLNGRIVVFPSRDNNGAGIMPEKGYIRYGTICVQTTKDGKFVWPVDIAHEFGHGSGQGGHTKTLSPNYSVMGTSTINNDPLNPIPLFADKKMAKIIYENSYKHGQGRDSDGLLKIYDVLGRRFLDE